MGKGGDLWQKVTCKAPLPEQSSMENSNFTWKQSDKSVIISLNVGRKVKRKNIKVEFSKYTGSVFIANERKWHFKLFDGILPKESHFKLCHTKIVLIMKKVYYCYTWLGLESGGRMPFWSPEELVNEKKKSINGEPVGHSVTSPVEQQRRVKQVESRDVSVDTKKRTQKKGVKEVWPIKKCKLKYIPTYWRKVYGGLLESHLRVRGTNTGKFNVALHKQYMELKVQTTDEEHLSHHPGTDKDTVFIWKMPLTEDLDSLWHHYDAVNQCLNLHIIKKAPNEVKLDFHGDQQRVITESETQSDTKIQHPGYDDDICILGAMIRGFHDDPTDVGDCAAIQFAQSDSNNPKSGDNSLVQGLDTSNDKVESGDLGKAKLPSFYDLFVCKPRKFCRS